MSVTLLLAPSAQPTTYSEVSRHVLKYHTAQQYPRSFGKSVWVGFKRVFPENVAAAEKTFQEILRNCTAKFYSLKKSPWRNRTGLLAYQQQCCARACLNLSHFTKARYNKAPECWHKRLPTSSEVDRELKKETRNCVLPWNLYLSLKDILTDTR
jgi:hypothetical protein